MFNTMAVTKVGGALAGALLVFLLINWAGDVIYSTESNPGISAEAAYLIDIPKKAPDTSTAAATTAGPSVAEMVASADITKGQKIFSKCKACHKITEGTNAIGPSLYGVVGRDKGTLAGFSYSKAMLSKGGAWTVEDLDTFLTKPKDFVPGTKMGFGGIKKQQQRVEVIAYLQSLVPGAAKKASAPAPSAQPAKTEAAATAPAKTEPAKTAAATPTPATTTTSAPAPAAIPVALTGDATKGVKVFKKCKACHKIGKGQNGIGPSLYGIVGRPRASAPGYTKYSAAMKAKGGTWTEADLSTFLTKPRDFVPGTKMGFGGLKKEQQRVDLIAFLKTLAAEPAKKAAAPAPSAQPAKTATATAATTTPAPTAIPVAALTGDATKGVKVFKKCKACHKIGKGQNGIGPSLYGVVGRPKASEAGYTKYSAAMKAKGGTWTEADLSTFLTKPRDFVPGTKMGFGGLKKEQQRVDLIAYLKTLGN